MSATPSTIPPATIPLTLNPPEHPAIEYIAQLFGFDSFAGDEDDNIFFLRIHQTTKEVRLSRLKSIQEASSAETIARLEKDEAEGFNVFVCMNPFPSGTRARKERLVENVRNLFIESDGANTLSLIDAAVAAGQLPAPHTVLESSPGKYHICWHVLGFGPLDAKAMLRALAQKFGGDPASTDLHRVLRLPGFCNLKYPDNPEVRLLEFHPEVERHPRELFKIQTTPVARNLEPIASDELALIAKYVEENAAEAKCLLGIRQDDGDSFKWILECPWASEHSGGNPAAAIILLENGKLEFNCFHSHCESRGWSDLRQLWEAQVGHRQKFGDPQVDLLPAVQVSEPVVADADVDENSEAAIPPFDVTVINGIYAKFVELATRGTTLAPQFIYTIAKTIVGAKMAGKVRFEDLDVEPRYYAALVGETGSGKGESWRRVFKIIRPKNALMDCKLKIINSADSGAGIKDLFFTPPEDQPVVCYVDEIESLGNKSKDMRNPGILDTMIELADSTSVSRILAKREGGGSRTRNDARFSMVMCGQDGLVYTKALAGRTKLGLWDRFYPEFGVAQETGDLPAIDVQDATRLLAELNALDYSSTIRTSREAKSLLQDFWNTQPKEVRTKARWKKTLQVDAFMSAFGRGLKVVELSDMDIAIRIFKRQLIIRRVCFTTEVPDRTGFYLGQLKRIVEHMERRSHKGIAPEFVAKSRRDFEREANAYRDNEIHVFERAWGVFHHTYLEKFLVKKANGQTYLKYLPATEE